MKYAAEAEGGRTDEVEEGFALLMATTTIFALWTFKLLLLIISSSFNVATAAASVLIAVAMSLLLLLLFVVAFDDDVVDIMQWGFPVHCLLLTVYCSLPPLLPKPLFALFHHFALYYKSIK